MAMKMRIYPRPKKSPDMIGVIGCMDSFAVHANQNIATGSLKSQFVETRVCQNQVYKTYKGAPMAASGRRRYSSTVVHDLPAFWALV